jgi:DNA polymerase III delta prime subunit
LPKECKNKQSLVDALLKAPTVDTDMWTSAQEKKLKQLKEELVDMNETELAVQAKQNARAVKNNLALLDEKDKAELLQALNNYEDDAAEESNPNVI